VSPFAVQWDLGTGWASAPWLRVSWDARGALVVSNTGPFFAAFLLFNLPVLPAAQSPSVHWPVTYPSLRRRQFRFSQPRESLPTKSGFSPAPILQCATQNLAAPATARIGAVPRLAWGISTFEHFALRFPFPFCFVPGRRVEGTRALGWLSSQRCRASQIRSGRTTMPQVSRFDSPEAGIMDPLDCAD
jgi:hypothetical protein